MNESRLSLKKVALVAMVLVALVAALAALQALSAQPAQALCSIGLNCIPIGDPPPATIGDPPPRSGGIYRIPYQTGTTVKVTQDHLTHTPVPNRYDMIGTQGDTPYRIVAAADGVIRLIEDSFSEKRPDEDPCNNNYVWIEHPNGEWTKYSHMSKESVTQDAGLSVGERVSAGQFLGFEDDVGCASRIHLHFEVAEPTDPVAIDFIDSEGFIDLDEAQNLIPRMCGDLGDEFELHKDTSYKAHSCERINHVHIPVEGPCTITGHNGANELNGTPGADVICGLGGDDTIRGLEGNDVIRGGPGNDTLYGGNGSDQVFGEEGDEIRVHTQDGVQGNDLASGGAGTDTCVTDLQDENASCP